MAFELPAFKYVREGIEACLEAGETLQFFALGTTKGVLLLQLAGGAFGVFGGLSGGVATGASSGAREFIVGLTDKRVLLVEVKQWGFDFFAPHGAVKQRGEVLFIAFNELKSVEYKRGLVNSTLVFNLPEKSVSFVFEKTPWISRAVELGKQLEARIPTSPPA